MVKQMLHNVLDDLYPASFDSIIRQLGSKSCEMIAEEIIQWLLTESIPCAYISCSVFEDNENGGEVVWDANEDMRGTD
jgi:hypothetical protein